MIPTVCTRLRPPTSALSKTVDLPCRSAVRSPGAGGPSHRLDVRRARGFIGPGLSGRHHRRTGRRSIRKDMPMLTAFEHGAREGGHGPPFPLFFLLLLVGGAIWFIRRRKAGGHGGRHHHGSPMRTLQDRFARGEIDRAEFAHRRAVLDGDEVIPPAPANPAPPAPPAWGPEMGRRGRTHSSTPRPPAGGLDDTPTSADERPVSESEPTDVPPVEGEEDPES